MVSLSYPSFFHLFSFLYCSVKESEGPFVWVRHTDTDANLPHRLSENTDFYKDTRYRELEVKNSNLVTPLVK